MPCIAVNDPVYSGATTAVNTPLLNGFIKIEKQDVAGVWTDVTLELLNLGFAGRNQAGHLCADPTPNAVLRFQRLRDNGLSGADAANRCTTAAHNYFTSLNRDRLRALEPLRRARGLVAAARGHRRHERGRPVRVRGA